MKFLSKHWLLLFALTSLILSIVLTPIIIFKPFEKIDSFYVAGRVLYVRLLEPKYFEEFYFTDFSNSTDTYSLKASDDSKLAVIDVEISNAGASEIKFIIGEDSAELLSVGGFTYAPKNPFTHQNAVNSNEVKIYKGFPIWGTFNLKKNELVKGFLVFETNQSFVPKRFTWKASDTVVINYSGKNGN